MGGGDADIADAWFLARFAIEQQRSGTVDECRKKSAKYSTFIQLQDMKLSINLKGF